MAKPVTEMGLELPVMVMAVLLAGVHVAVKLLAVAPVVAAVKITLDTVSPDEALTMLGAKGIAALVSVVVVPEVDAVTVTELDATLLLPSVMVMVATYSPATSALKLGLDAVVLTSEALLPAGLVNAHE